MNKFHIVGVEKSGTTSLAHYLKKAGHEVARHEWSYSFENSPQMHLKYWDSYQVVFIIRNPIERIWSDYHYRKKRGYIPDIEYKVALKEYPELVQGSLYEKWLDIWAKTNPIVINFEEMTLIPSFPKIKDNPDKPQISEEEKRLTLNAIEENKKTEFFRKWNEINFERDYEKVSRL